MSTEWNPPAEDQEDPVMRAAAEADLESEAAQAAEEDPQPARKLAPDLVLADLRDVLQALGVDWRRTDLVVVGDGSGSGWSMGGGWAAVVVDLARNRRKLLTGAQNAATSVTMEIEPYFKALYWYHHTIGRGLRMHLGRPPRVAVVSDNELVVKQGNGQMRAKALDPYWAAVDCVKRQAGIVCHWYWARRDTIGLNILCDHLSRWSRLAHAEHATLANAVPTAPGLTAYDVNPLP